MRDQDENTPTAQLAPAADATGNSEGLIPEVLEEVRSAVRQEFHLLMVEQFSGPLPRPQDLAKYDETLPGAAERILVMAEKEQSHRHEMDREEARQTDYALKADVSTIFRGQIFTFILIGFLVTATVVLLVMGLNVAAFLTFAGAAVTTLAAGIMGRKQPPAPRNETGKPEQGTPKNSLPETK